jgi:hypothetical protein
MTLSSALPIVLFALALTGVTRADNQPAQQSSVNAAICLLAVRSRSLPDRRSNLQSRYTDWPLPTALFDRIRRRRFHNFLMG